MASPFSKPLYPVPPGLRFGKVPSSRFSGLPSSGPLAGPPGLIFFSAALLDPSSSGSVDIAGVSVSCLPSDSYRRPPEPSGRLFRFGGGPGFGSFNLSRTNAALYASQPIEYAAIATLVQTVPPGPTTVFKVP